MILKRLAPSASVALALATSMLLTQSVARAQTVKQPVSGISRGDHYAGLPWATRSPVIAQHGMVASEQPLASQAGIEILKEGGNAGDAARWDHTGDATPTGLPAEGVGTVLMETGFAPGVAAALRHRGYKVKILTNAAGGFGGYEAIQYHAKDHDFWGASEMRRDGEVIGY